MDYDTYYNDGRSPRETPRRSLWLFPLDLAATLVTFAVLVAAVLLFFVPRIHPSYTWALPMLGLVAPAIYVLAVVLLLYWVVRWRLKRAALMLLCVLCGAGSVSLFWRPEVRRVYPVTGYGRSVIRCMTYNIRSFYDEQGRNSADAVAALIDSLNPEIVCLQEYHPALAARSARFMKLFERYETARFGLEETTLPPQVILSKYRILRSGVVTEPRTSVWAELLVGDDTVHVVNNHLQSTGITALDDAYISTYEYLSDTAREEKLRSIVGRFSRNCVLRADQVDSIRTHIGAAARQQRLIVCGDFNDTPVSYTYHRLTEGLDDAFSECGSGYSHTFRGFFNALRIDYLLTSEGFETLSYETPDCNASDHLPVFVRLRKTSLYR